MKYNIYNYSDKNRKKAFILAIVFALVILVFYPFQKPQPIRYVDRATGKIKTEQVEAGGWLF